MAVNDKRGDYFEAPHYLSASKNSYPYAYVIVDYRNERCQIAIEKSSFHITDCILP